MRVNLLILSSLALATAAPVLAKDFVVKYQDLDLSTAKDRKILERRIDSASRDYCGADVVTTGSRVKGPGAAACVADARKLAREQMRSLIEKQVQKGG